MSNNTKISNNSNNTKSGLYAAYGSNLSVSQMSYRCPDAEIVGTGKIMDYKLVFRLHADIEANTGSNANSNAGSYVPVLIWKISTADEKRLDKYEGVKGGYYHQEKVSVVMDDETDSSDSSDGANACGNGKEITAMAYIMNTQDTVSPPDAGYYQIIEDGYEHFGFDKKILETALAESVEANIKKRG